MNAKDVKCPICGTVNRSLDLDETDGWMECESCHNAVQILAYAKPSAFRYIRWQIAISSFR